MMHFYVFMTSVLACVAFNVCHKKVGMRSQGTFVRMGFETEVGALPPIGYFDPLGKSLHSYST